MGGRLLAIGLVLACCVGLPACTPRGDVSLYVHEPVTAAEIETLMRPHHRDGRSVRVTTYAYDRYNAYHETGEYYWPADGDWRRIR